MDEARVGFRSTDAGCIARPLLSGASVARDYPPTLLVHGTDDNDVPASQAEQMDAALAAAGIEHELILVPHAGHDLVGGDPRQVAEAFNAAWLLSGGTWSEERLET